MPGTEQKSVPSFPAAALTVALVLTLAAFAFEGWYLAVIYTEHRSFLEHDLQLQKLDGEILQLDEALTMTAMMGAATGEAQWEERYRQLEPKLAQKIAKASQLALVIGDEDAVSAVDTANDQLVKMEYRAFELVRKGDRDAAALLLKGVGYTTQKERYARGRAGISANLRHHGEIIFFALSAALRAYPRRPDPPARPGRGLVAQWQRPVRPGLVRRPQRPPVRQPRLRHLHGPDALFVPARSRDPRARAAAAVRHFARVLSRAPLTL